MARHGWHSLAQRGTVLPAHLGMAWHGSAGMALPAWLITARRGSAGTPWHGTAGMAWLRQDQPCTAQHSPAVGPAPTLHALHPNLCPVSVPLAQPDPRTPSHPGAAQGEGCSTLPGGAPPCGAERGPRVPAEAAPCPCRPHVQTGAVLGLLVGQQCHLSLKGQHRSHTYFCVLQVWQPPAFKLF